MNTDHPVPQTRQGSADKGSTCRCVINDYAMVSGAAGQAKVTRAAPTLAFPNLSVFDLTVLLRNT